MTNSLIRIVSQGGASAFGMGGKSALGGGGGGFGETPSASNFGMGLPKANKNYDAFGRRRY